MDFYEIKLNSIPKIKEDLCKNKEGHVADTCSFAYDSGKEVRKFSTMYEHKILPFYMAYPLPMYYQEEDTVIRDLEYLQQMYPAEAKKYQKIIASILAAVPVPPAAGEEFYEKYSNIQ